MGLHVAREQGTAFSGTGFMGSLLVDPFAIYFSYLFLAGAAIAVLMSVRYLEIEQENHGEFYALLLFSVVGMMCMAAGYDIVLLFIGLELMAISTYVLVGFLRRNKRSNEAALKYLLLGAFLIRHLRLWFVAVLRTDGQHQPCRHCRGPAEASGHASQRSHRHLRVADDDRRAALQDRRRAVPSVGARRLRRRADQRHRIHVRRGESRGLGDAASHLPLRPVSAALDVRAAAGLRLHRHHDRRQPRRHDADQPEAPAGVLVRSRMSATCCSGLVASDGTNNSTGIMAILFYLLVYTFMNLGAFAVITSLRRRNIIGDEIDDIAGLFFKAPTEAMLMLLFLLSLAGIPPLAGFWGKYFIFLSLIQTGHYSLAAVAVLYAVIGLYYYMRIANAMLMRQPVQSRTCAPAPGHDVGARQSPRSER